MSVDVHLMRCADLLKKAPTLRQLDQVFDQCEGNPSEVLISETPLVWMHRSGLHMQHCWSFWDLSASRICILFGRNKIENVWNKPALYLHVRSLQDYYMIPGNWLPIFSNYLIYCYLCRSFHFFVLWGHAQVRNCKLGHYCFKVKLFLEGFRKCLIDAMNRNCRQTTVLFAFGRYSNKLIGIKPLYYGYKLDSLSQIRQRRIMYFIFPFT